MDYLTAHTFESYTAAGTFQQTVMQTSQKFSSQKILVIGDFILDEYIKGTTVRISPEAPVPVVDVAASTFKLGGAANAALNLKTLSAEVKFCTHVGPDVAGKRALQLLMEMGLPTEGVLSSRQKKTQHKTRIISENQMIVRLDDGNTCSPDSKLTKQIIHYLETATADCAAVLLSDYEKGFFNETILQQLAVLKKKHGFFLAIDSKRLPYFKRLKPDLVKPNRQEAEKMLGMEGKTKLCSEKLIAALEVKGNELFRLTAAKYIALTLDKDGSLWFKNGKFAHYEPAASIECAQVCGAGDSFISTALLSFLARPDCRLAGRMATEAATIVIRKSETACCLLSELICAIGKSERVIVNAQLMEWLSRDLHALKKKIIFTNGYFDLLHNGHIQFLHKARRQGEILIVALNTDASVTRNKGEGRPINSLKDRIEVLSALGCIDYIIPFGQPEGETIQTVLETINPAIFVKGENYRRQLIKELGILDKLKIPTLFLPLENMQSTTKIIKKIKTAQAYAV